MIRDPRDLDDAGLLRYWLVGDAETSRMVFERIVAVVALTVFVGVLMVVGYAVIVTLAAWMNAL